MADIKAFHAKRLHNATRPKSIEWALDEKTPTQDDPQELRNRFQAYRKALDAIISPKGKGGGKASGRGAGHKKVPADALQIFKDKCNAMGVKFEESKVGDVAQLLAAVKARADEIEE